MNRITGSIVAIVTPMREDGSIDWESFGRLIDWHVAEGTACVGVVGTTGESPVVSVEEHVEVIRFAVRHAAGRIPVMAGTGGNSTREAIELSRFAKEAGADCTLSVVPYYNKPSQAGIEAHFRAIAEAVDIPMVLYNVPGRTVADLSVETTLRLAQVPNIVGLKDAANDIERACWLLKGRPKGFALYSGSDETAVAYMLLGGDGDISVTANVAPRPMAELCRAAIAGDARAATERHLRLLPLHEALFCEPSPAPTKWALARLGRLPSARARLPIVPLTAEGERTVERALQAAELI